MKKETKVDESARRGQIVAGVKIEDRVISSTGSSRSDRTGKGRYDLIPPLVTRRLALRYEGGAIAHGDRNWEKGMDVSRCFDSAKRHMDEWAEGLTDEDHLGAALWNIAAIMFMQEKHPEHLDMPAFEEIQKKALEKIRYAKEGRNGPN